MSFQRIGYYQAAQRRAGAPMSDDELRAAAPSIFAVEPFRDRSERYRFVPTIAVVEKMRAEGLVPVAARQGRVRLPDKREFTRHTIRFRRNGDSDKALIGGDSVFELVLENSHDGTSAYVLDAGLFRLICLNGLYVSSGKIDSIHARHSGAKDLPTQVIDASFEVIEEAPKVADQVEAMRAITLSTDQQIAFAKAAVELRDSAIEIEPARLLHARRSQDVTDSNGYRDLWHTFNTVQENIMVGGVIGHNAKNHRVHTRSVQSLTEDKRINKALWKLAEEMAKLAA